MIGTALPASSFAFVGVMQIGDVVGTEGIEHEGSSVVFHRDTFHEQSWDGQESVDADGSSAVEVVVVVEWESVGV